jgi:hypothetical protein
VAQLVQAVATAQVPPWGRHASGADVYHWRELVAAAEQAGLAVPAGPGTLLRRYRAIVSA